MIAATIFENICIGIGSSIYAIASFGVPIWLACEYEKTILLRYGSYEHAPKYARFGPRLICIMGVIAMIAFGIWIGVPMPDDNGNWYDN
jgi:hypothetical protein